MFLGSEKYTVQVVSFKDVLEEIKPLIIENHKETGCYDKEFNADFDRYISLDQSGELMFLVLRYEKSIVGYACFYIDSEIYQKDVKAAHAGAVFVSKPHRGASYKFMKVCDDRLKMAGVNSIWRATSVKRDIGLVYERLGYKLIEKVYRKGV